MSTHKKRRIEGVESPKPVSAISALAARRLAVAGSTTPNTPKTPEPEDKPVITTTNFYSPLRKTDQNEKSSSSKKGGPKSARKARGFEPPIPRPKVSESTSEKPETLDTGSLDSSQRVTQHSSFRPTKQNSRLKVGGVVELRLNESERFIVIGSFGIRVLDGEVTLTGASLRPSEDIQWVHAPHCHAVPVLRTTEHTRLELHSDPNAKSLRQLGRLSPLFRKMWNEPSPETNLVQSSKEATFQIIYTSEDAPKKCVIQHLTSPPEWNKKLASLVTAARKKLSLSTLVCGPKSAGKSTFSRLLINRLLTDRTTGQSDNGVVMLDLDPGQPEYVPAGTLSLVHVTQPNLGTPFTHPGPHDAAYRVIRCHALASVTPASDPDLYLACVANLYSTYREQLPEVPIVINTPGWILGTGLDLLSAVIEETGPDEVIYMSEEGPSETIEALQTVTKTALCELPSQQSEFTSRTAAHLRAMQTMSYFHLQQTNPEATETAQPPIIRQKWNPAPLSTKAPLLVRYSSAGAGILGILSYDYQTPPDLLADTINGMVMAAIEIEDPKALQRLAPFSAIQGSLADKESLKQLVSSTPEGLPFMSNFDDAALDPRYCRTIGLVLLRGIDVKAQELQIITPIPSQEIKSIRSKGHQIVLLHGKFDAPSWAYTEDLHQQAGSDDVNDETIDITDEDTDNDRSEAEPEDIGKVSDVTAFPWVEVLKGNERRPVGSRVWRVRRDLGRGNTGD